MIEITTTTRISENGMTNATTRTNRTCQVGAVTTTAGTTNRTKFLSSLLKGRTQNGNS